MDDLRIDRRHVIPASELEMRASRSGGPGGQGVNTTSSAVEIRWDLANSEAVTDRERERVMRQLGTRVTKEGVLIVQASDERSQHRNRELARERLAQMVATAIRPPKYRKKTKPSRSQKRKRLEAKRRRSEVKQLRKDPERPR